jgi:hypothetical protein
MGSDLRGPRWFAAQLVETVMGAGLAPATNPVNTGAAGAAGIFTGFDPALGITDGLVLSTGTAAHVMGPNTSSSLTTAHNTPGDADLGASTFDAATLEFDLVPTATPLTFEYIFGSDEYPEFVNFGANNKFALIVNGVNCAVVPSTTLPVSIDTLNAAVNSQYYVNGTPGAPTPRLSEEDGYDSAQPLRLFCS